MSVKLPDGSLIALATAYGAVRNVTALSNQAPPVATSAAHGIQAGDYFVLKSGWQRLNDRVFRALDPDTNTFKVAGQDATDVSRFPNGGGIGSLQVVSQWTQIAQILGFTTSGGDQQFTNFSFMEEDFERQLPTVTSAQSIQIDIADDPLLPGYIALKAAGEGRAIRALRLTLPDNSIIVYNGYVSFNETPTLTKGQVMQVRATFSLQGRPVRYAAA